MKSYIFITDEGCCNSPLSHNIENYQVLGIESGVSAENAMQNLLKNNHWIEEQCYSKAHITFYELASQH